jgi:hypothetical protein
MINDYTGLEKSYCNHYLSLQLRSHTLNIHRFLLISLHLYYSFAFIVT